MKLKFDPMSPKLLLVILSASTKSYKGESILYYIDMVSGQSIRVKTPTGNVHAVDWIVIPQQTLERISKPNELKNAFYTSESITSDLQSAFIVVAG